MSGLIPNKWGGRFANAVRYYKERRTRFDHELAVCAIFRDEGRYLEEWLQFHHAVGVDHFFLYDNGSIDHSLEVLEPWVRAGIVTVTAWTGRNQPQAYAHCIARHQYQCRWIAFIDIDEFLFSPSGDDLREKLGHYSGVSSIFVYWILFGSSGHVQRPRGGVIDNYTRCLLLNHAENDDFDHEESFDNRYVTGWAVDGKSIVNPRAVREYYVHKPRRLWYGQVADERRNPARQRGAAEHLTFAEFRINHYWAKSIEDLRAKASRPRINVPQRPVAELQRWLERESRLNRDEDHTIQAVWRRVQGTREGPRP